MLSISTLELQYNFLQFYTQLAADTNMYMDIGHTKRTKLGMLIYKWVTTK